MVLLVREIVLLLDIFKPVKAALEALFNPILNFVLDNVFKVLGRILEYMIDELGPYIEGIVTVVLTMGLSLFNMLLRLIGFNRLLAKGALNLAGQMYEAIICNDAIEKLGWTPKNFLYKGADSLVVEGSLANPYYMSLKIMHDAVLPGAMVIFSLIVLVELFQITIRTEGMRNSGFETPFKLMLKVAICKLVLDNSSMIVESIIGFGQEMFRLAYSTMGQNLLKGATGLDTEANINYLSNTMAWYTLILLYVQMFLQYLLIRAVMLIIPFLVLGRMVELYVMIALSPIPFSTFASQEFSQVGKSFLKQLIGVTLKGVVMYIVILVFALLFTVMTFDFSDMGNSNLIRQWLVADNPTTLIKALLEMVIKPLIFAFMMLAGITSSDKYVKQITGAMY